MTPIGFNHLQLAWRYDGRISPWLERLTARFRLVRYDSRGQGMSVRGLGEGHSMGAYVRDLEAVIEQLGLASFVLLGYAYFGHAAVRYALANPERVDALVLVSAPASMSAWPLANFSGLSQQNWELFLRSWVPTSTTAEERDRYVSYFGETVTQADWETAGRIFAASDVSSLLPELQIPALVLYPRDLLWLSIEEAKKVAGQIPNASLALIDGGLPMGDAVQGVQAIDDFLAGLLPGAAGRRAMQPSEGDAPHDGLSSREGEILKLIAAGRSNRQIADALFLSVRTVERHIANLYMKAGIHTKAQATDYAHRHGLT